MLVIINFYKKKKTIETCFIFRYHQYFIDVANRKYIEDLDESKKNLLILNMLSIYDEKENDDKNRKNGQISKRRINKTLEIIMKIEDKTIRSKQIIEKVFLNYKFLFALFNNEYFNVSNYSLNYDFIQELHSLLSIKSKNDKDEYLVTTSSLIQSICISVNDSLNKYPKSIGTQICSKIRSLYGLSEYFTKFIKDCDEYSLKDCSLIAPCQLMPLCDARIRLVHNFFREIIDFQDLGTVEGVNKGFYLYDNSVGIFNWNSDGSKKSNLVKEIELPQQKDKYKLLRVFKYEKSEAYCIIVATDSSISCFNDNGKEISRQKVNENEIIKDILLIGDKGFIAFYEQKDYINLFDTHLQKGLPVHTQRFDSIVKNLFFNGNKHWGWSGDNDSLYVLIFLENSNLYIFEVMSEKTDTQANIQLNQLFQYSFQPAKLVSGAFQRGVHDNLHSFRIFVTFESEKFLSIEMNNNKEFVFSGIKPSIQNEDKFFHILSYDSNFVVFTDFKSTHFYNIKTMKWFSIFEVYKDVDIFDGQNGFCKIYAYSEKYLDVYLLKLYPDCYKITKLINKFQFMDEIQLIVCNSKFDFDYIYTFSVRLWIRHNSF